WYPAPSELPIATNFVRSIEPADASSGQSSIGAGGQMMLGSLPSQGSFVYTLYSCSHEKARTERKKRICRVAVFMAFGINAGIHQWSARGNTLVQRKVHQGLSGSRYRTGWCHPVSASS